MLSAMENYLQDLIEEAKLRTVWWILCISGVCYFLTHTSKSMLMNMPVAILLVSGLRLILNEVEFRWRVRNARPTSYLSYLEKRQLSLNDARLNTQPPPKKWKRKINSPVVEAAINEFVNKILRDFVIDLWYSDITPDKEGPELIHAIVMDALGDVSGRLKEVNLVDLLTREVIDLIGDHIDLFRRNQAAIGVNVMVTLSSEERDERLKQQLLASKELHPALISPESEYKYTQQIMGGLLAVVLRPKEVQCPLVRCIAREILTCLVMQPIMNLVSPGYINELIEYIILTYGDDWLKMFASDETPNVEDPTRHHTVSGEHGQSSEYDNGTNISSDHQETDLSSLRFGDKRESELDASWHLLSSTTQDEPLHPHHSDWAKVLEAATQRRTEVLMPENLEHMWAIGKNYKKKLPKVVAPGLQAPDASNQPEDKDSTQMPYCPQQDIRPSDFRIDSLGRSQSQDIGKKAHFNEISDIDELANSTNVVSLENRNKLRRSNSATDIKVQSDLEHKISTKGSAPVIIEHRAEVNKFNVDSLNSSSEMALRSEVLHTPKLRCRVVGAHSEKLGSNSFAVYTIAVTNTDNTTWFVNRRYRNFERLHRHLKDIPNYTLHLPPKRIFSSSTEDAVVHQRCIQLDKYLQDLLSIANVAEQHEVWDFLSASSKNYSFGKSSSVMHTLAVNVDVAVDDIVRQFKEVSDGLVRKVVGSPSSSNEHPSSATSRNLSWNADDINKLTTRQSTSDSLNSFSDNDEGDKEVNHGQEEVEFATQENGWHSRNEMNSKGSPRWALKCGVDVSSLDSTESLSFKKKSDSISENKYPESSLALTSVPQEDPTGVPAEWTPTNLSVPALNLVDKVFQLNKRGWIRRQAFWMSMQILQLVMQDAIDDWLLRQIQWLRSEDVIALGIRWIQDVLWPDGTFFLRLRILGQEIGSQANDGSQETTERRGGTGAPQPESFRQQLEAARRASYVKNLLFNGAPTALVSLIGHKQYRRCARDIYYFLQSEICLKQVAYAMLELVLISIFPELGDLVRDIHEKKPL